MKIQLKINALNKKISMTVKVVYHRVDGSKSEIY